MGPLFGLPLSGYHGFSNGFSPVVQSLPLGPDALTGADYGPEGSLVAVLVLCFGLWLIMRVTREYASRFGFPEIIPGGIPVDIDAAARRQHEAAMGPAQPAAPRLVQIGELPQAAAPPGQPDKPPQMTPQGERQPAAPSRFDFIQFLFRHSPLVSGARRSASCPHRGFCDGCSAQVAEGWSANRACRFCHGVGNARPLPLHRPRSSSCRPNIRRTSPRSRPPTSILTSGS